MNRVSNKVVGVIRQYHVRRKEIIRINQVCSTIHQFDHDHSGC
jgi:hypothetical protein